MERRTFIHAALATSGLIGAGQSPLAKAGLRRGHVVVVGGGYAGATAAKYIRLFSNQSVQVTLIEPSLQFVSCPMSNLVVAGIRELAELATPYSGLERRHGVRVLPTSVTGLNADRRTVRLADGTFLSYDKLVMATGIDLVMGSVKGLAEATASGISLQAWKAGLETTQLRDQLRAMPNGGRYVITVPKAPYRCPPGPYERACLVADYFKQHKPRSKVLVLDANSDVVSKGKLFKKVWAEQYPELVEYRPDHTTLEIDAAARTLHFEFEDPVQGDVLNVLPEMRGGRLAVETGLANLNGRWAEVDYQTFESKVAPHIHVIGDTVQGAPKMPKSGHMANSQAKVAAAAIVSMLADQPPMAQPVTNNTCYSHVDANRVIHVASVHQYDVKQQTFLPVRGAGGLSPEPNELEAAYAWSWAQNIWADTLA